MSAETFKDPAAQMKRALFQSLAIGAVAVVLYMFCVEPCQSSLEKAKREHEDLKGQQASVTRDLKGVVEGSLSCVPRHLLGYAGIAGKEGTYTAPKVPLFMYRDKRSRRFTYHLFWQVIRHVDNISV